MKIFKLADCRKRSVNAWIVWHVIEKILSYMSQTVDSTLSEIK